jgi:hypothetical protein
MITSGEGRCRVWLEQRKIGDDQVFILGGGEKPHIGAVVICEPGETSNVVRLDGHRDDVVLKLVAESYCKKHGVKVVAVGGVHINNASEEEIDRVVENCKELIKRI